MRLESPRSRFLKTDFFAKNRFFESKKYFFQNDDYHFESYIDIDKGTLSANLPLR
jgi:hypothetical protein